jgi:hypothetical protein
MKAMSRLSTLNASFNRLGRLPDAVAELPHLCNVDASSNVLTALPVSWGNKSSCTIYGLKVYVASLVRRASLTACLDSCKGCRRVATNRIARLPASMEGLGFNIM